MLKLNHSECLHDILLFKFQNNFSISILLNLHKHAERQGRYSLPYFLEKLGPDKLIDFPKVAQVTFC